MFKNRGINHESQAITTTEAWLHYLSVQFQTRKRETFYKQANKYLTLSGYLCRTRRLIPQNERWLSGGIVANLPKVSSTFSAFPSSSSSSSSSRGKSSKKELNQGFYSISFFFLVVIKKQDVITVTCLSNLFLLDSRIFGFHLLHQNSKTKELSIILSVYFHDVLKQVKTNIYTKFHSQRALRFVIQCVWISKLLHCATRHLLGSGKICHVGGSEWSGSFDDCTDDYFFQFWRLTVNFRAFGGWLTVI